MARGAAPRRGGERVHPAAELPQQPHRVLPDDGRGGGHRRGGRRRRRRAGTRILVICDDAYFGLFYEPETFAQSLFARFCDLARERARREGRRLHEGGPHLGLPHGVRHPRGEGPRRRALRGAHAQADGRGALDGLQLEHPRPEPDPARHAEPRQAKREKREAYEALRGALRGVQDDPAATQERRCSRPLPFNSGYFMSFRLSRGEGRGPAQGAAAAGRVGTIAIDERCLRVAFSSVDVERLRRRCSTWIYAAAEKL